jgi:hypothetical protein
LSADHDIIDAIGKTWKNLRQQHVGIHIKHIKGHQDRNKLNTISSEAELNIMADSLATKSLSDNKTSSIIPEFAESSLFVNRNLVTADLKQILRKNFLSIDLREQTTRPN